MDQFDVSLLNEKDVDEVARLHERCFEGYFLTQLGRWFLRRYYAEFCRHDFDYGVVARCRGTGDVVAVVVGTADSQAHFRSFYRRNIAVLPSLVVLRFLTNRIIRKAIWSRMAHVKAALRSLIPGAHRPASEALSDKGPKTQCPVRLLGIAVAPEYRGSGVAASVSAGYEEVLRNAGHKRVGLSVLPHNERAIAFYKKAGWDLTYASSGGQWFEKEL